MDEFVAYTLSGLTTASIYAISAGGLTLTYSTTGIFNFAHGATGMLGAFTYWQLRYGWGWPTAISIAVVVLILAPLHGVVLERLVMRRLHGASDAVRLMVPVAVMLGSVALAQSVWDTRQSRFIRPLWPDRVVDIGDVRVPVNDLVVMAAAVVLGGLMWVALARTTRGVAMRAQVDNRGLTQLCGGDPVRNSQLAWVGGSATAALAGVLIAPKLTLSPLPLTLLIVNAYAASVIGGLRNLPLTVVGAVVLGLANDYTVGYLPDIETGQQYLRGLVAIVPAVVLFVALLALAPSRLPPRPPRAAPTPVPTWAGTAQLAAAVIGGSVVVATVLGPGDLLIASRVWGLALVGLSMIPLVGYAGRVSLCQMSFAAVGAVAAAHVGGGANPFAIVVGGVVAAAVGAVVALPALRLAGIHLALATAAFAAAMDRWVLNLPPFTVFGEEFTIFRTGSLPIDRPRLGRWGLDGDGAFLVASSILFAAAVCSVVALRRRTAGRILIAQRDSPTACTSLGLDLRVTVLAVFSYSAALAGSGGAVIAMSIRSPSTDRFAFFVGVSLLLTTVVAGVRSPGAAVFAGVVATVPALVHLFDGFERFVAMSIAVAAVSLGLHPNGLIVDVLRPQWQRVRDKRGVLVAGLAVLGLVWVLCVGDVVSTATWAVVSLTVLSVLPVVAGWPRAQPVSDRLDGAARWGLDQPFTVEQVGALDAALCLGPAIATGQRGGRS